MMSAGWAHDSCGVGSGGSTLELTGTTMVGFTGKAGLPNIGGPAICEVCLRGSDLLLSDLLGT